jgi:hypothetical protein
MEVILFNREEYEKIIFQVKQDKFVDNHQYFLNFPMFTRLEKNLMKKL